MGKPITSPSNVKVKATKTGKAPSSYFSMLGFTTIGDPYIDPERRIRIQQLEEKKKYQNDDRKNFIPASGYKSIVGAAFEHKADFEVSKSPRNHKGQDGRVVIPPRNIVTNPAAKSLQHYPPHMKDEYERMREFERQRIQREHELLKDKAPFKSTVFTTDNFQPDKEAFRVPENLPAVRPAPLCLAHEKEVPRPQDPAPRRSLQALQPNQIRRSRLPEQIPALQRRSTGPNKTNRPRQNQGPLQVLPQITLGHKTSATPQDQLPACPVFRIT